MAEVEEQIVQLFSPNEDTEDRYGRDFVHVHKGLGRVVMMGGMHPFAYVNFYDSDLPHPPIVFRASNVELVDAITEDETVTQIIGGAAEAEKVLS